LNKILEIERKFLVNAEMLPPLPKGENIVQAYLGFDPAVRVRLCENRAFMTVKGKGLISREEVEFEIPTDRAERLIELRAPGTCVVSKTRHEVDFGGKCWEVDIFDAPFKGLVMAEVELASADEFVEIPGWISVEVTMDPEFHNSNLSRSGKMPGQRELFTKYRK